MTAGLFFGSVRSSLLLHVFIRGSLSGGSRAVLENEVCGLASWQITKGSFYCSIQTKSDLILCTRKTPWTICAR